MVQFLEDISAHTIPTEPGCYAYCWFLPTADGPTQPCLRGLEVLVACHKPYGIPKALEQKPFINYVIDFFSRYADEDALAVTHRSSVPYKVMRASIDAGGLLAPPTPDLTFRTPSGVGFLSKSTEIEILSSEAFVIMSEYSTNSVAATMSLLENLNAVATSFKDEPEVLSYWALKWLDVMANDNILVFERYASSHAYATMSNKTTRMR